MSEYLSNRVRNLNIGIKSYTENVVVLDVLGNTNISGISSSGYIAADNANISGIATIKTIVADTANIKELIGLNSISVGGTTGTSQYVLTSLGSSLTWQSAIALEGVTGINVVEDFTDGLKYLSMQLGAGTTQTNIISSNELVYNSTTKNLGIGTANPTSKLTVQGDANITGITTLASLGGITTTGGDLYVGGNIYFKNTPFPTKLSDLTDVEINDNLDKYVLMYDSVSQKWKNVNPDEVLIGATTDQTLGYVGIPSIFTDKLDQDLDNRIDVDAGIF